MNDHYSSKFILQGSKRKNKNRSNGKFRMTTATAVNVRSHMREKGLFINPYINTNHRNVKIPKPAY